MYFRYFPWLTLKNMVRSLTSTWCVHWPPPAADMTPPSLSLLCVWWILMCWLQSAAVQHATLTLDTSSLVWLHPSHPSPRGAETQTQHSLPPPGCLHRLSTTSWSPGSVSCWLLVGWNTRRPVRPLATWTAVLASSCPVGWLVVRDDGTRGQGGVG